MKKKQRFFATILAVLISVSLVGSAFVGYFVSSGVPQTDIKTSDYQARKVRLAAMTEQAEADPGNIQLQKVLGNEYYDAGLAASEVAPTEVEENFKQAVKAYQNVLKTDKDPSVMVDMATAAFSSGDHDLAEKTFKEALALKPDFYTGLVNYGIFLVNVKQDIPGAIAQWQKAQEVAPNDSEKVKIDSFISQAHSQLNSKVPKSETNGLSNPSLEE